MKGQNPPCPCGSGARYNACCRRFHQGAEPDDAEALMRSRFSAYARGEVDHLWRTLHPEHPDRARPGPEVTAELRAFCRAVKLARLRVLEHEAGPDRARVLFHAELYGEGKEQSFAELSTFHRTAEGWRYHSGRVRPMRADAPGLPALRIAGFEA